jgi:hypothetical protein
MARVVITIESDGQGAAQLAAEFDPPLDTDLAEVDLDKLPPAHSVALTMINASLDSGSADSITGDVLEDDGSIGRRVFYRKGGQG